MFLRVCACSKKQSPVAQVRRFVEEELKPNVDKWIKTGYPLQLHQRAYELGIQGIIYPPAYGGTPPPDFDAFYELIMVDEMSRVGGGSPSLPPAQLLLLPTFACC